MNQRRFGFALALLLALALAPATFSLSAPAQDGVVERIQALERSESRVMEHLDHLTNRIGPRLTGSDGFRRASEWAREQFESFGLENCHLEAWGEFPVGFNRGPSSGHMLAPEKKELHFGTNAWTAGTHGPTAGLAVMAPTNDDELAALRPKLKGAWVLAASAPARPAGGNRPNPPVAGGTDARPSDAGTTEAGARGGANADQPAPAAGGELTARGLSPARSSSTGGSERAFRDRLEKAYDEEGIAGTIRAARGDLILTGGSSKIAFDKLPTRPSINLLAAEHKEITELVKAGKEVRLEFDVRNWFTKGPITNHNVIAELRGSEKPDEVVIVSGHLDSWDGATGAVDNGTGVSTTLEAARLLVKAGVHPKRTIRFILWGGEEQGLLGSKAYIAKHKSEMDKVSAVLVHDGGTNYCAGINATPPMVKDFEAIFAPVTGLDPEIPFKVREVKGLSPGSSDHDSFLAAGVPGFFWNQKGKANYTHAHHTQFDTYDQAVPEYQMNSSVVIAVGALGIANLPALLSRENLVLPGGRGGFGGRRLGVQLAEDMTIEELVEDGLAIKAGLLVGDRIVKVGTTAVGDSNEMRSALNEGPAKTTVTVLRKSKELEVAFEFPANSGGAGGGFARRVGIVFGEGLTVESVTADSAAEKAGIKAKDRIVKVGDTAVEQASDVGRAFFSAAQDGDPKVVVMRDGKEVTLTVKMPEAP